LANILPYDASKRRVGDDWPPFGHTMVGLARIRNIRMAIESVIKNGIEGDYVELGVWRGGSCIYAKALIDALEPQGKRRVVLLDAFGELPGEANYGEAADYLSVSLERVRHHFSNYGVLDDRVDFVKGLFNNTAAQTAATRKGAPVAVLRIDGNFYDSYADALYAFYESVPVGGFIIFDDIRSHPPVLRCWQDFVSDHGIREVLLVVDEADPHAMWFQKKYKISIDQKKRRPHQVR
jgi:O-methyltransferase